MTMPSIFITLTLKLHNRNNIIHYFCDSEYDRNSTSSDILRTLIWQVMNKGAKLVSLVLP